jgi:beta-lactamase class D
MPQFVDAIPWPLGDIVLIKALVAFLALFSIAAAAPAFAKPLCTIVANAADDKVLLEQGDCRTRVTPASTFKIALAVIGFETGYLKNEHEPVLPFKEGYVDWGGDNWKQPTDPARWIKYSVVWYSQIMAHTLGAQSLTEFAQKFGFGNADFTGDPGKNNGLDRAWIGSSLKISPFEQTVFLRKLVRRQLPVSERAMSEASKIVDTIPAEGGWDMHGKTGAAFPRLPDGTLDEAHGFGWYVGWAVKDGRTLVFATLTQDEAKEPVSAGLRARETMISTWPMLVQSLLK